MSTKYAAKHEDRVFYFFIVTKEPEELRITMYGTPYTFIKKDGEWRNHSNNQMMMVQGLINGVIEAAEA